MKVCNVHECELHSTRKQVGKLLDSLASPKDALWPKHLWPRMAFDRPLGVGATGGHGPIRYVVEEYKPGRSIKFRVTGPKGFNGFHMYEMIPVTNRTFILRHIIHLTTRGFAILSWPIVFQPLHNALIEDSFAVAQASLGQSPDICAWSPWVKFLRWIMSGGKAKAQVMPGISLY